MSSLLSGIDRQLSARIEREELESSGELSFYTN
jgi:hypothetical protein